MTGPASAAVSDFADLRFRVAATGELGDDDRRAVHDLFDVAYDEANHAYLEKSLSRLRFVALARAHGGQPVGFALGDVRRVLLPRMREAVPVTLGGLGCISPDHRRRHLWSRLNAIVHAASDAGPRRDELRLTCGRMAHPASFRGMRRNPTVVPRPGPRGNLAPTPWQREVALAVAAIYGSRLDPETCATIGDGRPIGYPRLDVEATPEEWAAFERVDRSRGDALLAIAWSPRAPVGWDDELAAGVIG